MNWIKENIGKVLTAVSLISALIGLITGLYIQQKVFEATLDSIQEKIKHLEDDEVWYIKQWIANPANYR